MDSQGFREAATATIDESTSKPLLLSYTSHILLTPRQVITYFDTLPTRNVVSSVEPGYLRKLLPAEAPQDGEPWPAIQHDIQAKILPGITHW